MSSAISIRVTGRDFSRIENSQFEGCVNLPEDVDRLELLKVFLENEKLCASFDKDMYGPNVGVIRDKKFQYMEYTIDITVQLKSRFDDDGHPHFLAAMLLSSLSSGDILSTEVPSSEEAVFDFLLLYWFKQQMHDACKKGIYRTYRRFERNDDRPRGTIDIARHIRLNGGLQNGKIAYAYREHTADNALNHLILAAYQHLKRKYSDLVVTAIDSDAVLKRYLDLISAESGSQTWNVRSLIAQNLKPIAHPYFTEYEQLRVTCLRILRDENASIFEADTENESVSIKVDVTKLWEKFLEKHLRFAGFVTEAQKKRTIFSGYTAIPDFVFYHHEKPLMILDAKFKPAWEEVWNPNGAIKPMPDYLCRDFDKCVRDMCCFTAHKTGVIFPTVKNCVDETNKFEHDLSELNTEDKFYMFPICVPDGSTLDFSDWMKQFEENIQKVLPTIHNYLKAAIPTE